MQKAGMTFTFLSLIPSLISLRKNRLKFFDYPSFSFKDMKFVKKLGYGSILEEYRNKYKGEECFLIGNGPSIKKMDLSFLKNKITFGSNGIYKIFNDLGFSTTFTFFEDREQTYLRRKDINALKDTVKLVALTNSYCIKRDDFTIFFNERFPQNDKNRPFKVKFSPEFSSVAFLGGTVSFVMLQWAYFLGFSKVYVLGLDHNYGELPKLFPPGKIEITANNIDKIKGLHFSDNYYKVGDVLGVPDVEFQDAAYKLADKWFKRDKREVINIGVDSKLNAFKKKKFEDLF